MFALGLIQNFNLYYIIIRFTDCFRVQPGAREKIKGMWFSQIFNYACMQNLKKTAHTVILAATSIVVCFCSVFIACCVQLEATDFLSSKTKEFFFKKDFLCNLYDSVINGTINDVVMNAVIS